MANFTPGVDAPAPNTFASPTPKSTDSSSPNSFYAGMGIQQPSSLPRVLGAGTPGVVQPATGTPSNPNWNTPSVSPTDVTSSTPPQQAVPKWTSGPATPSNPVATGGSGGTPPPPGGTGGTPPPAVPGAWKPFDPNVSNVQVTQNTGAGATGNYSYNGNDYSTQNTANSLASLLGGKVVTNPNSNSSAPQYMIQLPNGSYINAGEASAVANANGGINNPTFQNYFGANGSMLSSALGGSASGPAYDSSAAAINPVAASHTGVLNTGNQAPTPTANSGGVNYSPEYLQTLARNDGNTASLGGGTDYSSILQLLGGLGGGATSNAFGNSFNPSISQSSSPSFYGNATTSPLNSNTNTGVGGNNANSNNQMNMLLAFLLSGGNTSALSQ